MSRCQGGKGRWNESGSAVPSLQNETDSYSIADSILHSLLEFQPELWGLPHFEDWVDNALPIEPIHLFGVYSNGLVQIYADRLNFLPDQIGGLYVGWVRFDAQKVSKAVISIGWSLGFCTSKRKILLLVGYLRRSCSVGDMLNNPDILDEDKLTAAAALNLPEFSHKSCKTFLQGESVKDDVLIDPEH